MNPKPTSQPGSPGGAMTPTRRAWVSLIAAVTTVVFALGAAVWTNDHLMGAALCVAVLAVLTRRQS